MNPWDVVSWISSAVLAGSAVVIFVLFLRDAREVLNRNAPPRDDEPESSGDR